MIYKLFAHQSYYPGGGYHDFISAHPTIEAAREALLAIPTSWTVKRADLGLVEMDEAHIVFDDKIVESWEAQRVAKGWTQVGT